MEAPGYFYRNDYGYNDASELQFEAIPLDQQINKSPTQNSAYCPKSELCTPDEENHWAVIDQTPQSAPPAFNRAFSRTDKARRKLDLENLTTIEANQDFKFSPEESATAMFQQSSSASKPRGRAIKRKVPGPMTAMGNKETPTTSATSGSSRLDNSLLMTTRKFLSLKDKYEILNLNEAAERLLVPKRRLYDITNVLEGIDLVEKVGKNSIRFKTPECDEDAMNAAYNENKKLMEEEALLDTLIHDVNCALKLAKEDPTDKPYSYVSFSDLRSIDNFNGQTLIAIKAPQQSYSYIEVADPVRTGKFQLMIRNQMHEPLQALLCPSDQVTCQNVERNTIATEEGVFPVQNPETSDQKEVKIEENAHEQQEIVIPDATLPSTSSAVNDLITPGKYLTQLQSPGSFMSPLKMLVDPSAYLPAPPSMNDVNAPSNSFLSLDPEALDDYQFRTNDLNLQDLFSGGEWDINSAI